MQPKENKRTYIVKLIKSTIKLNEETAAAENLFRLTINYN
jgi:hypothetical protein